MSAATAKQSAKEAAKAVPAKVAEAVAPAKAEPAYTLLQKAWGLGKDGWAKSKEYPMLKTLVPLVESTAVYSLKKAGLPEFAEIETTYIKPALSHVDEKYVDKIADKAVNTYDSTKKTTVEKVEDTKKKVEDTYGSTRSMVFDKVDKVKEYIMDWAAYAKSFVIRAKSPESTAE